MPKERESALEMHIKHTIAYSGSILKSDYTRPFGGFEEALHLADILSDGIAKQFPDKFIRINY